MPGMAEKAGPHKRARQAAGQNQPIIKIQADNQNSEG